MTRGSFMLAYPSAEPTPLPVMALYWAGPTSRTTFGARPTILQARAYKLAGFIALLFLASDWRLVEAPLDRAERLRPPARAAVRAGDGARLCGVPGAAALPRPL